MMLAYRSLVRESFYCHPQVCGSTVARSPVPIYLNLPNAISATVTILNPSASAQLQSSPLKALNDSATPLWQGSRRQMMMLDSLQSMWPRRAVSSLS